jgi:murein DD-endopeptidase MepM/ murein hydrolase activator NlpD
LADAKKKGKWISIMIVPEDGAGVKKWRLTTRAFFRLKILLGAVCVLIVLGFVSMLSLGVMFLEVKHYQSSNARLLEAARKVAAISARLDRYLEKERTLRDLLGGDIELPPAPETDQQTASAAEPSSPPSSNTSTEIEQAIASKESLMRRRPNIWPVNAWQVVNRFRQTGSSTEMHQGIDIIAPMKSSVMASADGRVMFAGKDDVLGLCVVIDHENGWETRYGHNESLLVKSGDTVKKGQPIAVYGGRGGASTGAHLHFEVYYRAKPVDPLAVLPSNPALMISKR